MNSECDQAKGLSLHLNGEFDAHELVPPLIELLDPKSGGGCRGKAFGPGKFMALVVSSTTGSDLSSNNLRRSFELSGSTGEVTDSSSDSTIVALLCCTGGRVESLMLIMVFPDSSFISSKPNTMHNLWNSGSPLW